MCSSNPEGQTRGVAKITTNPATKIRTRTMYLPQITAEQLLHPTASPLVKVAYWRVHLYSLVATLDCSFFRWVSLQKQKMIQKDLSNNDSLCKQISDYWKIQWIFLALATLIHVESLLQIIKRMDKHLSTVDPQGMSQLTKEKNWFFINCFYLDILPFFPRHSSYTA